ncbi:MAG TPA: secretion system protein E, partial [Methanospirillum sp.]|nr:secretion system protein E [Methanospirillum sp.]
MGESDREKNKGHGGKNRRTIKIKVPSIIIGKKTSPSDKPDKAKKNLNKPKLKGLRIKKVPHIDLIKKEPEKETGTQSGVTRIKLPLLKREEEIVAAEKDLESIFQTEKESAVPGFERKLLKKISLTQKRGYEEYDFEKHGSLLDIKLGYPYESKNEYWVEPGLAKVVIAHNIKSKLREYLLFEPELTPFEYELLERIHEDLRDVLILTDEELGIERKKLLISKVIDLIDYYGLKLDKSSLFKINYYLLRNYLGWGRINALMIDPLIEDIS